MNSSKIIKEVLIIPLFYFLLMLAKPVYAGWIVLVNQTDQYTMSLQNVETQVYVGHWDEEYTGRKVMDFDRVKPGERKEYNLGSLVSAGTPNNDEAHVYLYDKNDNCIYCGKDNSTLIRIKDGFTRKIRLIDHFTQKRVDFDVKVQKNPTDTIAGTRFTVTVSDGK